MGLHREQQSLVHADRPRKHPYARRRPRRESRALLLLVGVRIRRRQAGGSKCHSLKESDAYPAMPEDGYGWETLFTQRMCQHFWKTSTLVVSHCAHADMECTAAGVPARRGAMLRFGHCGNASGPLTRSVAEPGQLPSYFGRQR
jgi:hypothetical protein